ncbi:hypothetical protein RND81_04G194700 [Saponaria officinalis]|uniref:SCP domain-containing protein n=1 Tax=Saponaria officinalis TaxID=3572 RepID=A0AAW1LMS1_SAPOF
MGWLHISIAIIYTMSILFKSSVCELTQDDKDILLKYHNRERANVLVPPLKWSKKLEKIAQISAKKCHAVGSGRNGPYGENLAGYDVVNAWHLTKIWGFQRIYYNCAQNKCVDGPCSDYVQIVWRNTTLVGCASAICNGHVETPFFACEYYPPGRIPGQRPY